MSKKNSEELHQNAKQKAYAEKQAQKGDKIVKWIFFSLILLALAYMIWAIVIFG